MRGRPNGPLREEAHDMRTTRHPIRYVLSFVGMGLMLAGLFGGPVLPTASAADVELFVYQNDRGYQTSLWVSVSLGTARLLGAA